LAGSITDKFYKSKKISTSSISQDGHGMLHMLAESKKGFLAVKIINMIYTFFVGIIAYFIGI